MRTVVWSLEGGAKVGGWGKRRKNTGRRVPHPPSFEWPETWLDHFLLCLSSLALVAVTNVTRSSLPHSLVVPALPSPGHSPRTGFPVLNTVCGASLAGLG